MIRNSLKVTQEATFAIELPNPHHHEMPTPMGTGFFVSPDGWFVTAAHVITENGESDGPIRNDLSKSFIMKETRLGEGYDPCPIMCIGLSLEYLDPITDFALLKIDFKANASKAWLKGKTNFPFIEISYRNLEEGESVYSFGYPLPESSSKKTEYITFSYSALCPRVTSAIVSSTFEKQKMVMTSGDPKVYVLDKALNYGNSGGPIVATETGKVHAICSRFQPVYVPQSHLADKNGNLLTIMTPSLYGVVSSFGNLNILKEIKERNIPISNK
jgi:serine protease Do